MATIFAEIISSTCSFARAIIKQFNFVVLRGRLAGDYQSKKNTSFGNSRITDEEIVEAANQPM